MRKISGPLGFGGAVLLLGGLFVLFYGMCAKGQTLGEAQTAAAPVISSSNGYPLLEYFQLKNTPFAYYFQTSNTLLNWTTPNNPNPTTSVDAGSAWFNTISDTIPIGSVPARFLRLTIFDPTDVTDFLFPPTDLSVSLPPGPTNAALVWSDNTMIETGYAILRETGTTGGFQTIAVVGPDVTNYNDYAVQGSTTYTYEVAALNLALQSAASNTASVTTLLDSNGDGIADIYKSGYGISATDGTNSIGGSGLPDGWLVEYGFNPFTTTDASADPSGKGWTLGDDYANGTNPNLVDTDGDGVPDVQDEYPLDPRRSRDVPIASLSLINISAGTATTDVTQLAMDDEGNPAFGFVSGTGSAASFAAYLWQNGAPTLAQTVPLMVSGSSRWVVAIDASGNIYGWDGTVPWGAAFEATDGSVGDIYPPEPPYAYEAPAPVFEPETSGTIGTPPSFGISGVSNENGFYYGPTSGAVLTGSNPFLAEDTDDISIIHDGQYVVFDPAFAYDTGVDIPTYINMQTIDAHFNIAKVSGSGAAIGNVFDNFVTGYNGPTYWDGEQFNQLPGPASNFNDSGEVVGVSTSDTTGYLWQPTADITGSTTLIQTLIPSAFQNQIRNIVPVLIGNPDPNDSNSLNITFTADSLEGSGTGSWIPGASFILKITGTATDLVETQLPSGGGVPFGAFSPSGVAAGIGYGPDDPATESAYMALNIHFEPADSSDDSSIEKGFDPPMKTDHIQGVGYVDLTDPTNQYSTLKPAWWSSLAGSGTSSVSQKVKIVFPDAATANACHMKIISGASNIVSVTDSTGNDLLGDSTHFSAKETTLKITGANSSTSNIPATLQVAGLSGTAGPTLTVDVLPVRNIDLGIYYVTDTNSIGTPTNPKTELPTGIPDISTIISNLNLIYQQACITFTSGSSSGVKAIAYDSGTNGNLDGYLADINPSHSECAAVNAVASEKLNVIIVGKLNFIGTKPAQNVAGIYPGGGNIVYVFAQKVTDSGTPNNITDTFLFCQDVAHEIGHALGLSTRTDDITAHNADTNGSSAHDPGPFPIFISSVTGSWVYNLQALMFWQLDKNHYYWMRHEDWEKANKMALDNGYVTP